MIFNILTYIWFNVYHITVTYRTVRTTITVNTQKIVLMLGSLPAQFFTMFISCIVLMALCGWCCGNL